MVYFAEETQSFPSFTSASLCKWRHDSNNLITWVVDRRELWQKNDSIFTDVQYWWKSEGETPSCSSSGLRTLGWQFSSPCSHNGILRSASKWLISPQALWRSSSQSRSACANISSGDGALSRAPEHHSYFTSRMFSLREGKVTAWCRHTIHFVLTPF